MAERRQLPIEHGQNARLVWIENDIVEPEVAVDDPGLVPRRNMDRQPLDEPVHGRDVFGLRGAILLRPTLYLALDVVSGPAVVAEPDLVRIERIKLAHHPLHFAIDP